MVVGPGQAIKVNGKSADITTLLEQSGKVSMKKRVLVRMDLAGDALFYWKVRKELSKSGCGYIEAPPKETDVHKGGGK